MRVRILRADGPWPSNAVEAPCWPRCGAAAETEARLTEEPPVDAPAPPDEPVAPDWHAEARATEDRLAKLVASAADRESQARAAGHAAGLAEGIRQAEAAALEKARRELRGEYEQALAAAAASAKQVLESRRQMRRQMEEDLARLAVSVARRILHRELHVDPEALVGIVKAVVDKIEVREVHRLLVAPYDLPFLANHVDSLGLPARVELIADPGLTRGSLILETSRGHLDSSVETQLQEIDRGFADLVRRTG